MNIAFWDNQLGERGTTTSLFDYAYYNQILLGNKSYVFYCKHSKNNNNDIIQKFKNNFDTFETNNFSEVDDILLKYKITHIFIIKSGNIDHHLSKIAKNCIHCVFNCYQPHGEIYSSISQWVRGNNGKYPVIPYMINLPKHNKNLREVLNIPYGAIVYGGYGGRDNFNIPFVHKVIFNIAKLYPNIYFLFANFNRFCPPLHNIIHLPTIIKLDKKVEFINTCDAMIWARKGGETFGSAIAEFSTLNKPVIAMKIGDKAHIHLLGNKGIWYNSPLSLGRILLNFNPKLYRNINWNVYEDYTPEKVMKIFKEVFLD